MECSSAVESYKYISIAIHNQMKLKTIVWILIVIFVVFMVYKWIVNFPKPYTSAPVHWHAQFEVSACGESINLPRVGERAAFLGEHLLHTHDDNKAHIEGQVWEKEDVSIKAFIDAINLDKYVKSNGCDSPLSKILVDNFSDADGLNHIMADGETIKLIYG